MRNWNSVRLRANRLLTSAGVSDTRVPLERVAEHLGLKVVLSDELEEGVSGLLVRKEGSAWIIVRRKDPEKRRRFTIAHEIGHFCLQHEFGAVHVDRGYRIHARGPQASIGEVPEEVEANQFAAALLMPEHVVKTEVERLGRGGFAEEDDVSALAEKFGVSVQAMTIRLNVLELL